MAASMPMKTLHHLFPPHADSPPYQSTHMMMDFLCFFMLMNLLASVAMQFGAGT
jgi:hypothetical protein